MKVIGHQGPGKASGPRSRKNLSHPAKKMIPIGIAVEYLPALNPAGHDVVHGTGCIYA